MTPHRDSSGTTYDRNRVQAKAAPRPSNPEWPLAAAFGGAIAMMLLVNAILNLFPA